MKHEDFWAAIDALALINGMSISGLAVKSGLDATIFHRHRRYGAGGRECWPNVQSLDKALRATRTTLAGFARMVSAEGRQRVAAARAVS